MINRFRLAALILCIFLVSACDSEQPVLQPLTTDATVLAFGDSLTYGTGANHETESYPAKLATLTGLKVVNAGIPGEVSGEGLARIDQLLEQYQPDLVILCHGGNDLLRKLDKAALRSNLDQIIAKIQSSGAQLVLLAVPAPGIFLKADPVYEALATQHNLVWSADIITDVESKTALKSDPIHPNKQGYAIIAQQLQNLLSKAGAL